MIGKTIFKYRSAISIAGNKDVSPKAIVWLMSIVIAAFYSKDSLAQGATSLKTNTKAVVGASTDPAAAKKIAPKSAVDADDNGDDDSEEAAAASPTKSAQDQTKETDESEEQANKGDSMAEDSVTPPPSESVDPNDGDTSEPANANIEQEPTDEPVVEADSKKDEVPPPEPPKAETLQTKMRPESKPKMDPVPEPVSEVKSQADYVEVIPKEKNVEVISRKKYTNYRERRTTSGFLINVNAENIYFPDYKSVLDGALYETLFGQEDLSMAQGQVGYKFNFFLGSLVGGVGYGSGTLIDDRSSEERTLTMDKKMGYAQWLVDSIMKEPYFVPYVGFNYWQMSITEKNNTKNTIANHDTGNGTSITVGFLVQLNWLEPETAKLAYLNNGLENTYLDIFWTQYQGTDDGLDPKLENNFNFGVGLRMEF